MSKVPTHCPGGQCVWIFFPREPRLDFLEQSLEVGDVGLEH